MCDDHPAPVAVKKSWWRAWWLWAMPFLFSIPFLHTMLHPFLQWLGVPCP